MSMMGYSQLGGQANYQLGSKVLSAGRQVGVARLGCRHEIDVAEN
jgi:hypothetical protein